MTVAMSALARGSSWDAGSAFKVATEGLVSDIVTGEASLPVTVEAKSAVGAFPQTRVVKLAVPITPARERQK
jgi:hypothetical protein